MNCRTGLGSPDRQRDPARRRRFRRALAGNATGAASLVVVLRCLVVHAESLTQKE